MDGTMCEGKGCPMRESCYRYNAEPNPYRQSYFMVMPLKWIEGGQRMFPDCEEYWEYPKKEKK